MPSHILSYIINHFNEIGSAFSIAGVFFAGFLTWFVFRLDKNRRKRDEMYYETQTKSYVHDILTHFVEIDKISRNDEFEDFETVDEIDEDIKDDILIKLNRYYKQNYRKMEMLLENSKGALSKWVSLSSNKREKYSDIISDFDWLVKEYFKVSVDEETQARMWNTQYKQVTEKRYQIDDMISLLIENN
jgi:hypothetical protein